MKETIKRITSLLLLAVMLVGAVACADNTPETSETTLAAETVTPDATTEDAIVTEPEVTELNAENILGPRDFEGHTVSIYSRVYSGSWTSDLFSDNSSDDILDQAIAKRNAKITEYYDVNIEQIESGKQTFYEDLGNRIASGDTSYQVIFMGVADAAKAAQAGYLLDITQIKNINLEGEWWTQSLNELWSIGNSQYFATGAITTLDDKAIRCMFFNKEMLKNLQLTSIYELVDKNEWIFDKFFEYVEIASKDNGDGVSTTSDTFGIVAQETLGYMMMIGTGELLTTKDADDYPTLELSQNSTRFIDVVDYLTAKINDNSGVRLALAAETKQLFGNGQALFFADVLYHAKTFRTGYDINFGIIPMPKYSADQEKYYQYADGSCPAAICFPNTVSGYELEEASFVIEAMAVESVKTITPAYYEICLKGRYADDFESQMMLDLITTSVVTEFAEFYGWGGLKSGVEYALKNKASVSSIIQQKKTVTEEEIEKTVTAFKNQQ